MLRSLLIIDDSTRARNEIKSVLATTGLFSMFYEAPDGISGFKEMISNPPDMVICNVFMQDPNGLKFLKLKKSRHEFDSIPVLVVANKNDLKKKLHVLEEGAHDYVTKPFTPIELVTSVKSHLRIKVLHDELVAANKKLQMLEMLSNIDPLTGLYNRRFFLHTLEREFERVNRYSRPLSMLMLDMDHFKYINDRCGHPSGDKVLNIVAGILNTGLRKMDVCARYGGDEFIIMLPETNSHGAMAVAERYMKKMRQQAFASLCDKLDKTTCSIGISCIPASPIKNVDDFLKSVDDALYIAKNSGRNRISVYSSQSHNM